MPRVRRILMLATAFALAFALMPAPASGAGCSNCTAEAPFIAFTGAAPAGSWVQPIVSSNEFHFKVRIPGIPDGMAVRSGGTDILELFVAHEETTVPFRGSSDLKDASVVKLTLKMGADNMVEEILGAEFAIHERDGFLRFCSASMATAAEGFVDDIFFANEETSNIVPTGAGPYGDDPGLDPGMRQGGYTVAHNTTTGENTVILGMGRLNHEQTLAIPHSSGIVTITTDDTFSATTSQLYMYTAADQAALLDDAGKMWAFRVTSKNGVPVPPRKAFNGANDYLDIVVGDDLTGEFIRVPKSVARGTSTRFSAKDPQGMLEEWSNRNNVFQFIRLEDAAYDKNDPSIVYVADTGASRVVPNPATGRLMRGPSGTVGLADNGRMFKFVFDPVDPTKVTSFTVFAEGDGPGAVGFRAPDNIDTSTNSLMVQEDASDALIWMYSFAAGTWTAVASVNDSRGESSGIVDASPWLGEGYWFVNVQAHGTWVKRLRGANVGKPGVTLKREAGQVMEIYIPGS